MSLGRCSVAVFAVGMAVMASLIIRVLGPFQVELWNEPITSFATDKVRALLVYLALSPDQPHRRETLAGLLWPEFPERSARTNLRNALANLRSAIRDQENSPPFFHVTRQTIQFNGRSDYWLDADAFEDQLVLLPTTGVKLERTLQLVRGPFLEGFSLADAAPFEEWLLLRREHFNRRVVEVLDRLADYYEENDALDLALPYARRRVGLEPFQEDGQRRLMRLLFKSGRRTEAMNLYRKLQQQLAVELAVEPAPETTRLFEQIQSGELRTSAEVIPRRDVESSQGQPGFVTQAGDVVEPPVFVAREDELASLNAHIQDSLSGHGHLVFVTGGPGRGKTALLTEFSRLATNINSDLLVASGSCNAFSGAGDPYLPFREIMGLLTGDVESRWSAGAISTTQARRLWKAFPTVIQSLLQYGPDIPGPLVSQQALLARAALWSATESSEPVQTAWLHRLRKRIEQGRAETGGIEQSYLFQQVTNVIRTLAKSYPLLFILDDLQWADSASINLLFYLGRRLEGSRILIAGAYRAAEVASGRPAEFEQARPSAKTDQPDRRPLAHMLREFKRYHGDIWLDLAHSSKSKQRHFVDALLDTEANHLGETFREELTRRAGGHPLFTLELVRAMKTRSDLVQDAQGYWLEGAVLDWDRLPARVQGAIETRIACLDLHQREILSVASVEGENISVQVLAQVRGMDEGELVQLLAQELVRRQRLLVEQAELQVGSRRISRFRFSHALIQSYLYQQLSEVEQRTWHSKYATALENCYGEEVKTFAVQLAHHHSRAGNAKGVLHYFSLAAENAGSVHANEEARDHFTRAIKAAARIAAGVEILSGLYLGRGRAFFRLDDFESASADYEKTLLLCETAGNGGLSLQKLQAMKNLGRLWTSRDYNCAHDYYRQALDLAREIGEPRVYAESLNLMGNWHLNRANPREAAVHHQQALEICHEVGDKVGLAVTYDMLGIAGLLRGDATSSVENYDRAIPLFRELDDQASLASSLTGRGHLGCSINTMLASAAPLQPITPRQDFEEALRINREIGSLAGEAWSCWSLATLEIVRGRYGQALDLLQHGLEISEQIEHREWIVGNRCIFGMLYLQLLMPHEAKRHLDVALSLAKELGSLVWIRQATASLAAACFLLKDFDQAQVLLDSVLVPDTAMDTMNKRYCWARRAELALYQEDHSLAIDIVDRLITIAPGMAPGRVMTYLWKIKAEALTADGDTGTAFSLLGAAVENAHSTGERFLLWQLHRGLGWTYQVDGCLTEADQELSTSRELLEELVGSLPDGKLRTTFLKRGVESLMISQRVPSAS